MGGLPRVLGAERPRPAAALAVAAVLLILASAAVTSWAGDLVRSPAQVLADTAPPPRSEITEAVTRATVRRTVPLDAVVEHHYLTPVTSPSMTGEANSAVVSRLPVATGQRVKAGALLAEVSGRPVLALPGTVPAYRTLGPGATGADVTQLQRGLRAAGVRVTDREGVYGASTSEAVNQLFRRHGHLAADVGTDELRTAQDALVQARRSVEDSEKGTALRRAEEDLQRAVEMHQRAVARSGWQVHPGEIAFVPALPARVIEVNATLGGPAEGTLLTLASGRPVLRGIVRGVGATQVVAGSDAEVLLAPGGTLPAKVRTVTEAASEEGGATGEKALVVSTLERLPHRDLGTAARIVVAVDQAEEAGLVVPLAAVSMSGVKAFVVRIDDGKRERVWVEPGFSGDGEVVVVPTVAGSLSEGDRVVVGPDA